MFDLRLLPVADRRSSGERLARITVGTFTERFACFPTDVPVEAFPTVWISQLHALIDGRTAVALRHDPRFAWIVYREGEQCFVQQRMSLDGDFASIPPRQTVSVTGERVSEWPITLAAIAEFLEVEERD